MRIDEPIDPERDLVLDRDIPVPPALVWQAWTRPEHLREWFTPRPWTVAECDVEPWPGGRFHTVMRSPEGQLVPNTGCFLEVIPDERLVWTSALGPGFRPAETVGAFTFTGNLLIPSERLAPVLAGYVGRPLGFDELRNAAAEISLFYRKEGYVAAVSVPKQEVKGGVVLLKVAESRFGGVSIDAASDGRIMLKRLETFRQTEPVSGV